MYVVPRAIILLLSLVMLLVGCDAAPPVPPAVPTNHSLSQSLPRTSAETMTTTTAAPTSTDTSLLAPLVVPASARNASRLRGSLSIDGSSTVFPITEAAQRSFQRYAPDVQIELGVSGTGGGFAKFCAGETIMSNASRPLKVEELAACAANGIQVVEVPIAFDGLSVVVHPQNDWAQCLTVAELKTMWQPDAEATVLRWSQVRPEWPDRPLDLYGAGGDSGTYDYFTSAIVGEEGASRRDYTGSEDDYVLAQAVAENLNGLAFFGLAYYREYAQQLRLVAIDGGAGCVTPSDDTISNGSYQPLSRPLFIYVRADALERAEVQAFVEFYVANARRFTEEARYIPLTRRLYALSAQRVAERITGSVFEGGSQVGLSLEMLLEIEQRQHKTP
jgi:phosphate transport system substrate-binding protein